MGGFGGFGGERKPSPFGRGRDGRLFPQFMLMDIAVNGIGGKRNRAVRRPPCRFCTLETEAKFYLLFRGFVCFFNILIPLSW